MFFIAQTTQSASTQPVIEVAVNAAAPGTWAHFWLNVLMNLLLPTLPVLGGLIAYYCRQKLAALTVEKEKNNAEKEKNELESGRILMGRIQEFLLTTAVSIAENQFPQLAKQVIMGKVKNADDVRSIMEGWSRELRDKAVRHFESQGVKINEWLTDDSFDDMIRLAADNASPFPGMVTANVITQSGAAQDILHRGVNYVRQNYQDYNASFDDIKLDGVSESDTKRNAP